MSQSVQTPGAAAPLAVEGPGIQTRFDFYTLPRSIQDRFVASTSGGGIPQPVLFKPLPRSRAWAWLIGVVGAPVLLLVLMLLGYGNLESLFSLQPVYFATAYAVVCGGAAFFVYGYFAERSRASRFPYALGSYLYPAGVVVAEGPQLRLYPLQEMSDFKAVKRRVTLVFAKQRFSFQLREGLSAEQLRSDLEGYQKSFAEALERGNRRELAVLDPLRDSGFSNPLSSMDPLRQLKAKRLVTLAFAVVAGAGLGVLFFLVRNKLAETALYNAAVAGNSSATYESYLARRGKRPIVSEILLPRARLTEARGSLEAVEAYSKAHPDSRIRSEIDVALREELLSALVDVKSVGSLKALDDFKAAHPDHQFIAKELEEARANVFVKARQDYLATAKTGVKVQRFFQELIDYSEQHGPEVEVVFRSYLPTSIGRADTLLRKSAYFAGNKSLPAQYFTRKYAQVREDAAHQAIVDKLQGRFSKEILHFKAGKAQTGKGMPDVPEKPTLFVIYRIEMSGAYTTRKPRGVFVALSLRVHTEFYIPGRDKPFRLRAHSSWLPPDTSEIWRLELTPEQVYSSSAKKGFDRYLKRLLTVFVPEALSENPPKEER